MGDFLKQKNYAIIMVMLKSKWAIYLTVIFSIILLSGCARPVNRVKVPTHQLIEQKIDDSNQILNPNNFVGVVGAEKIILNAMDNNMEISDDKISTATFKTSLGRFGVKFYRQDAPKTVANFIKLAKSGFYDATSFHRVIKNFMIQGGDPLSKDASQKSRWGTGGPGYRFDDEFNNHKLVRGSLAMANSGPNTNGSQFFIVTAEAVPWLDGKHTNFGEIVSSLDIVLKIGNVKTGEADRPMDDIIIEKIELK